MTEVFNIGKTIKILSNTISLSSFNEADGKVFYQSNKKQIQRMQNYDITKMNGLEFENYNNFIKKYNSWVEWAIKESYLTVYQQNALTDFYLTMYEAASINMPINKNLTEHFFCYALSKVLHNQIQDYMKNHPNESKYDAMYWTLAKFDFFGKDDRFIANCNPVGGAFILLENCVKNINQLISYWEEIIAKNGKRDNPPNIKDYILKWQHGRSPSWNIIKLFFDNDLTPPKDFFINDEQIKSGAYQAFKRNLYLAFILTNLFDTLVKEKLLTKESRIMIRNGTRLFYRDFYVIRDQNNPEYSKKFEKIAKENLMFRTLFCMLDANLSNYETTEYLQSVNENPDIPILLD